MEQIDMVIDGDDIIGYLPPGKRIGEQDRTGCFSRSRPWLS
jgi:hypothetical protein